MNKFDILEREENSDGVSKQDHTKFDILVQQD